MAVRKAPHFFPEAPILTSVLLQMEPSLVNR